MRMPRPDALPLPAPEEQARSDALAQRIRERIQAQGGWLGFDDWMHLALYSPGLGYYSGPRQQFGAQGDFVTAPELSPLFGRALAAQVSQWLREIAPCGPWRLLEFGAGSGALAASLLPALAEAGTPLDEYLVLEVSGTLRAAQAERLAQAVPQWSQRVRWLASLPTDFEGVMLANEVLDAIPVRVFERGTHGWAELGVRSDAEGLFHWAVYPGDAPSGKLGHRQSIDPVLAPLDGLMLGYRAEVGEQARAWVNSLAGALRRGAMLFIDYGFPEHELFHPQRSQGTLMAHYRHRAHPDVLARPGLQDLTAHVNFSAIADAAGRASLDLAGFTSQARFLINCGVLHLAQTLTADAARDPQAIRGLGALQTLLSEAEMGELFKAIAFTRGLSRPQASWVGFQRGDRSAALGGSGH